MRVDLTTQTGVFVLCQTMDKEEESIRCQEVPVYVAKNEEVAQVGIIDAVERFTKQLTFPEANQSSDRNFKNLAISLATVYQGRENSLTFSANANKSAVDESPPNSEIILTLSSKVFNSSDGNDSTINVIFILYRNNKFFLTKENSMVEDYVIAASVLGKRINGSDEVVVFEYPSIEKKNVNKPRCSYWEFTINDYQGDWSQKGCKFARVANTYKCHCNHLTNYALLLDPRPEKTHAHNKELSIISYIGCSVSTIGISLTIFTMLCFRELLCHRTGKIFFNICLSLLVALIVFLAAAERRKTWSDSHCKAASMLNHFLFLSLMAWMVLEACTMYLAFVKVLPKAALEEKIPRFRNCILICYGIPSVFVFITAVTSIDNYGNDIYCFLTGMPMIVMFFVPVALCILINIIIFVRILRSLLTSANNITSTKYTTGMQKARRGLAISFFIGLTWISGLAAICKTNVAFQYIFCITNSLQGFMIFLFYCVFSADVRAKWRNKCFGRSPSTIGNHREVHFNDIDLSEFEASTTISTRKIIVREASSSPEQSAWPIRVSRIKSTAEH